MTKKVRYIIDIFSFSANFWSMVYDHDCSTVVVLNNPPGPRKVARSNTSFVKFWPDQDYATYGPVFSVQTVDKLVQPDFSVWQLRLGKKHALKKYD